MWQFKCTVLIIFLQLGIQSLELFILQNMTLHIYPLNKNPSFLLSLPFYLLSLWSWLLSGQLFYHWQAGSETRKGWTPLQVQDKTPHGLAFQSGRLTLWLKFEKQQKGI